MKSLVNGSLSVKGEASVNLGGDLAGDNVEDLTTELDEQAVESSVNLVVLVLAVLLSVLDGFVNELGVLGLLGSGEDQGGVGGRILRLVLLNGVEVTGVADDGLIRGSRWLALGAPGDEINSGCGCGRRAYGAGGLELVERRRHCEC